MATGLADFGEEYIADKLSGESFDLGLYNDSTDTLSDSDDLSAITTEPTGASYARQTESFSSADLAGDWGLTNDTSISFDTSDSTQTVDTLFLVVNFTSDDAGDGSATDHIFIKVPLSSTRDLSNWQSLEYGSGDIEIYIQ